MTGRLLELGVENFRSLRKMTLPLGPLNVLVGPNGAGKTNVLDVFRFLADVIRTDLEPALEARGGFDDVLFQGGKPTAASTIKLRIEANWTASSEFIPDRYELEMSSRSGLSRRENFEFALPTGGYRKIQVEDRYTNVALIGDGEGAVDARIGIQATSSGLSTLSRLDEYEVGHEINVLAQRLASCRNFSVDVSSAQHPSRFPRNNRESLDDDAANLAAFLFSLRNEHGQLWEQLVEDAVNVLPQLEDIDFVQPSGAAREIVIVLRERGLRRPTQLADASFGTIRLLGLLALLYDPNPPALTCVEEIDHGLHPQALELLVDRLREASARTQFLVATHSPAMVDRLKPDEFILCERRDDGSSAIPALPASRIAEIINESQGVALGELWFSGALGGDL